MRRPRHQAGSPTSARAAASSVVGSPRPARSSADRARVRFPVPASPRSTAARFRRTPATTASDTRPVTVPTDAASTASDSACGSRTSTAPRTRRCSVIRRSRAARPSSSGTTKRPSSWPASSTRDQSRRWSTPSRAASSLAMKTSALRVITGATRRAGSARNASNSRRSRSPEPASRACWTSRIMASTAVVSAAGRRSAARQVMVTAPSTRRLSGSGTGAATQAKWWNACLKCSSPRTVVSRPVSSAVPRPLVPATSSSKQKPGCGVASSSRGSAARLHSTRPARSATARPVPEPVIRSTLASRTGRAARARRLSWSTSAYGSRRRVGSTPLSRERRQEVRISRGTSSRSASVSPSWKRSQAARVCIPPS